MATRKQHAEDEVLAGLDRIGAKASLVYQRVLTMDRETKGTFRYVAENPLTGRDVTLYVEKADFATSGIDAPESIVVMVSVHPTN